jgi:hypothetical protein
VKRTPFVLVGALSLWVGVLLASQRTDPPFSHPVHERLFPVCEGCHIGVLSGAADQVYPTPLDCGRCHDGLRVKRVEWDPPPARTSNLRFLHAAHQEVLAGAGQTANCQTCHAAGGVRARMSVGAAPPTHCLQCHAHAAETHLAGSVDCSRCHVPLSQAEGIPAARVARFPRPASHEDPDFLSRHAPDSPLRQASCGICHARETCERCHVNADRLPQVIALERDARVAALEAGKPPAYPVPASHLERGWGLAHGSSARAEPVGCSNCHSRPSCTGCHLEAGGSAASVIASLPVPAPGRAPGVSLGPRATAVHPSDFAGRHASWAATGGLRCAECHAQRYCADCHSGADSRAFHPANFLERHAPEVFAGGADCQSCHSAETFCRSCHAGSGVASQGRMNAAFHTGQPLWVLSHGQAARMGMESCASCHRQNDCMRCHSAAGGWGISPHGRGFAASRMAARSPSTCRLCHVNDPLGRNR